MERLVEQRRYAERKRGRELGLHRAGKWGGGAVGWWGDFCVGMGRRQTILRSYEKHP